MPIVITLENGMTVTCWGKYAELLKLAPQPVRYYEATPENARKLYPHLCEEDDSYDGPFEFTLNPVM